MNSKTFEWLRHPDAEAYVAERTESLVSAMPKARAFAAALEARTSSTLADWLDYLVLADGEQPRSQLRDLGFRPEKVQAAAGEAAWHHPGAVLPRILLGKRDGVAGGEPVAAALHVEDIRFFLLSNGIVSPIQGTPLSPLRRATAWRESDRELSVIERRGHAGFVPVSMPGDYSQRYLLAWEQWAARPRRFVDARAGMEVTLELARSMVRDLGKDAAAWIAFSVERAYWERRNEAAQVQKARQDSLGLGWANHDHHTFRSSRQAFPLLIQILETFGFEPRERFYAGAEAGWGAQVMEQSTCRFAVFADVDLSPDEVDGDFAHRPLPERGKLGTVGLWCALHGESMLDAGLHHLAGRFDFDRAIHQLAQRGIETMRPFSDFTYLRQAFTQGERWTVSADRLERLVVEGLVNSEQQARFSEQGAIGSHLENIQRREGFKGFNQQTISDIIRRTDPRA
jgi:hypothetical protein